MGWFEDSGDLQFGGELISALIEALGLDDSSQGGMFDKSYVSGREYYGGVHIGVCHGPVDVVKQILFKGKVGWSGKAQPGQLTIDDPYFHLPVPRDQENPWDGQPTSKVDTVIVNQPDLFGGEKIEGGVLGVVNILHGAQDQGINTYLNTKLKSADPKVHTPAYRGILSLVFHSDIKSVKDYVQNGPWRDSVIGTILAENRVAKFSEPVTHHTGFYWGAMTPGFKEVSVKLFRAIMGWHVNGIAEGSCWYPEKCIVTRDGKQFMNPAHIAVQCLTDLRFGMKAPLDRIGASFTACADQLWDITTDVDGDPVPNYYFDRYGNELPCEGFGLGLVWTGENSIRGFLADIMRYVNGNIYIDHSTGMIEMVLVRKVPEASFNQLPILGPGQIMDIGTFSRPTGEEQINTISLVYSDYNTEKTETVTRSNTAMVSIYGAVISETLTFLGIKNKNMAAEVCEREVRQRCSMAGTYSRMQVTRGLNRQNGDPGLSAFNLYEGAPFRLNWPEHNIEDQVFRAANINYKSITDNFVEFDAIEDVFGAVDSAFVNGSPGSGWEDPAAQSDPFTVDQLKPFAVPYTLLLAAGGTPLIRALAQDAGLFGMLANTPAAATTGLNLFANSGEFPPDRYSATDPAVLIGASALCPTSTLAEALPIMSETPGELQHTVRITDFVRMSEETIEGAWCIIGDEKVRCVSIDKEEFLIDGFTPNPNYLVMVIERGLYDTVPAAHAEGETVWWFNGASASAAWSSFARYTEGDDVRLYAAPYGRSGGILLGEDTAFVDIVADNAWFAPYPPADVKINGEYFPDAIQGADFTVEWACRNKVTQSDVPLPWDSPGVEPEAGTTFNVRVYDPDLPDGPEPRTLLGEQNDIDSFGSTGYYRYTGGRGAGPAAKYQIEIEAVKDGKKSVQLFTHTTARFAGYGLSYGYNYSGGDYAGVKLNFGDSAPPIITPTAGYGCPRPAWIAGDWMAIDATIQADGGIGYKSQPSAVYDYYHVVSDPDLTGPEIFDSGSKPYNHKLCCSKGTVGGDAVVVLTDGDSLWRRQVLSTGWVSVAKPSIGLFSSPGYVNSVSHSGTEYVVCMNFGADIYTATDAGFLTSTFPREGTASESNGLLDLLQAEWIHKIGSNYIACGKAISDYTKTAIASSTDLVNWTLRTIEAPIEARDDRNWVWFKGGTDKFYIFSTVGDPDTGSVFAYTTTNGYTLTTKSIGAPPHTPVVGRGFTFATAAAAYRLQVFAGAYLFSTDDGVTWTKSRALYAPEQVMAAMASPEPFTLTMSGTSVVSTQLESKHLLLRTGRYLFDDTAPAGHPGRTFVGAVMAMTGMQNAFVNNTHPEPIQPTTLPYGNKIGALGDVSTGISDAGFSNSGNTSDDVYGFIGRNSGSLYFEVHVGAEGSVLVGVSAALGPEEPAPVCSALLNNNGKVFTNIRLACPGGLNGGSAFVSASVPTLSNAVVGVHLDLTAGICRIYVDGVLMKTITDLTTGLVWFPVFTSRSVPLKLNLGQSAFQLIPPGGSSPWLS